MITWLASYPKSGNTWIRALLTAYFNDGHLDINNLWGLGDTKRYYYQAISPKKEINHEDSLLLRPAALLNLMECEKQKPLIVKTHHANMDIKGMPLIPQLLTKQAFYIVRDPRDVVISYSNHMGRTIDQAIESLNDETNAIGEEIFHFLASWSSHVNSWLSSQFPTYVIKYETLQESTKDVLRFILKKLGIPVNEKRMDRAISITKFSKLKSQEEKKGFKESQEGKFFKTGKSTWREVLSIEQRDRIMDNHMETMERLGYLGE